MDNKNVIIYTLYSANNVGAFLQAFSLQQTVEKLSGYNVYFSKMPALAEKKNQNKKILSYLINKGIKGLCYKYRSRKCYLSVAEYLHIYDPDKGKEKEFDIAIIGSDEVWNALSDNFVHREEYYGKGINANSIAAYAPSANLTTYDEFTKKTNGVNFSLFNNISVRDTNTKKLVEQITGKSVPMVLDPTLIYDSYETIIKPCKVNYEYILVYSYGLKEDDIKKVCKFAKSTGLPLLSVGTYNKWCDRSIPVDPFEFLGYMKSAKYVITSTFHGTILSYKLKCSFVTIANNNHKIFDVMNLLGISERRLVPDKSIKEIFSKSINYIDLINRNAHLVEKSKKYLSKCLENNR